MMENVKHTQRAFNELQQSLYSEIDGFMEEAKGSMDLNYKNDETRKEHKITSDSIAEEIKFIIFKMQTLQKLMIDLGNWHRS